ncbi:protein Son-like [Condylostylus longicornis]|uniref:protein Son-like n=1 Tax=Condylostylus longicornis TaxID=2530218 RepID=UPI00244E2FE8|nr:protein Son-like [Condylostylus longicornis]
MLENPHPSEAGLMVSRGDHLLHNRSALMDPFRRRSGVMRSPPLVIAEKKDKVKDDNSEKKSNKFAEDKKMKTQEEKKNEDAEVIVYETDEEELARETDWILKQNTAKKRKMENDVTVSEKTKEDKKGNKASKFFHNKEESKESDNEGKASNEKERNEKHKNSEVEKSTHEIGMAKQNQFAFRDVKDALEKFSRESRKKPKIHFIHYSRWTI